MRFAPAIRGAESCERNGRTLLGADEASPAMLATDPAVRVSEAVELHLRAQVIDVPVRPERYLCVVRDAGAHSSRSPGAAHIYVEAASKLDGTEFPDLNPLIAGTRED